MAAKAGSKIGAQKGGRSDYCEPPVSSWEGDLKRNRALLSKLPYELIELRDKFRAGVLSECLRFEDTILGVAEGCAIKGLHSPLVYATALEDAASLEIIATGHQPVILHTGVMHRYNVLSSYQNGSATLKVQVAIDTDAPPRADFVFPVPGNTTQVSLKPARITTPGATLSETIVATGPQLEQTCAEVIAALQKLKLNTATQGALKAGEVYSKLSGQPVVIAHALARRAISGLGQILEVPLSNICKLPSYMSILALLLADANRVHSSFNSNLEAYRGAHKIENIANPFPNLKRLGSLIELPFWVINQSGRKPLFVGIQKSTLALYAGDKKLGDLFPDPEDIAEFIKERELIIAPRAVLVTFLLRVFFSDLFLHGTGGAKYDQFTDSWIEDYLGIEAPSFAVVTADKFLFPSQIAKTNQLESELERLSAAATHFHAAAGLLPRELQQELGLLVRRRQELVSALSKVQGVGRVELGKQLAVLTAEIRTIIGEHAASGREKELAQLQLDRAALFCREYPFFFFDFIAQ